MADFDINLLGKRYTELNPTTDILPNSLLAVYRIGQPELNKITFVNFQNNFEVKNLKDFFQEILVDGQFVRYNTTLSKFVQGTVLLADIPNLPASKITSGIFNVARIPDLTVSKITGLQGDLDGKEPVFNKGNVISNYLTIVNGTGRVIGASNLELNLNFQQLVDEIQSSLSFFTKQKFTYNASSVFSLQHPAENEKIYLFHVGTKLGVLLDDSTYSIVDSTLTVNTDLEVGDVIQIEYFYTDPLVPPSANPSLQDVTNVGNVTSLSITHAPAISNDQSATLGQVYSVFDQLSSGPDTYLVNEGIISNAGNLLTVNGTQENREWIVKINGVLLINDSIEDFTLTPPATGQFRRDLISMNSSGNYVVTTGTASADSETALAPSTPTNSVAIGEVFLNDTAIQSITNYVDGSFVSFAVNQNLNLQQQLTARNNIDTLRKGGADTHTGSLTQNGAYVQNSSGWTMNGRNWLLQFPNDTHSSTSFIIRNTVAVNPGGMFMTERGSTIIRARGDSVTNYYILRLEGSNALQRVEVNNSGIWANQRSANELYLIRRDENWLTYPTTITGTGKLNNVELSSANGMIIFGSDVTEVSGIVSGGDEKKIIIWSENPSGIILKSEDIDSDIANRFYNEVEVGFRQPVEILYRAGLNRWVVMSSTSSGTIQNPSLNLNNIFIGSSGGSAVQFEVITDSLIGRRQGAIENIPFVEATVSPPAAKNSLGIKGQEASDLNYYYKCIETNTWIRMTIDKLFSN